MHKVSLLTATAWQEITKTAKSHPNSCKCAVAYFGTGASRLLPLKEGSLLVVDLSIAAVKSGRSDPREIRSLIRAGVRVHSLSNLHAKVFAFPRIAFVGSTNASRSSANGLIEAVLKCSDAAAVSAAGSFVESLTGEEIGEQEAKALVSHYKPPPFGKAQGPIRKPVIRHAPLWLVPLVREPWESRDYSEADTGRPAARRKMQSGKRFKLDEFCWTGSASSFVSRVEFGDRILQVTLEGRERHVTLPGAVLAVRKYREKGQDRAIFYLEIKRDKRRINLKRLLKKLGSAASDFRSGLPNPKLVRSAGTVHKLLNLLN